MKSSCQYLYNNCLFAILYLYLRGKVDRIALVKSNSIWPHHYICITRTNHFIDFQHHKDLSTSSIPFWFLGSYVCYTAPRRTITEIITKKHWFMLKLLLICIVLFIPYMVWFGVSKVWFCLKWSIDAIKRN